MMKRTIYYGTMLAVLAPAVAAAQTATPDTRTTIAVLPFANSAIQPELAPLTKGFQALLLNHLAASGRARVVERDEIQRILTEQQLGASGQLDPATIVNVGKILGAKYMITGTYITDPRNTMKITIRAFNTETSEIIYTDDSAQGSVNDLMTLIDRAANTAATRLNLPALPAGSPAAREAAAKTQQIKTMPRATALLYARAIEAQDTGNRAEARQLYRQVMDRMPDFEPAKQAYDKLGTQ